MSAPQLLTLDQVAERMGITRSTVERLVNARLLATIDIRVAGKRPRLRVSEAALEAFYKSRAV